MGKRHRRLYDPAVIEARRQRKAEKRQKKAEARTERARQYRAELCAILYCSDISEMDNTIANRYQNPQNFEFYRTSTTYNYNQAGTDLSESSLGGSD
jgi:hypothetical protein